MRGWLSFLRGANAFEEEKIRRLFLSPEKQVAKIKKLSEEAGWPFEPRHFLVGETPPLYRHSSLSSLVLRPYFGDLRETYLALLQALEKKYQLILPNHFDPEMFQVKSCYSENPKFGFKWVGVDFLENSNISPAKLREQKKIHFLPHIEILSAALLFDWPASMGRVIENRNGTRQNIVVPYVYLGGALISFDGGVNWGTPFLMCRDYQRLSFGVDQGTAPSGLFSIPCFCHREREKT